MSPEPRGSPDEENSADEPLLARRDWTSYAPEYNQAFVTALKVQGVLAVVTALALDQGQMFRAFWVALLCQWALAWIILLRRPMHPTRTDLALVRYGIVGMLLVVAGLGPTLLRVLGIQV